MTADEIVATLLADTNALGVWLLGRTPMTNELTADVLAGAVNDSSVQPPLLAMVDGSAYFDLGDRHLFAERFGNVTLVVIFNARSSHGLVRLRVRGVKDAIRTLADSSES